MVPGAQEVLHLKPVSISLVASIHPMVSNCHRKVGPQVGDGSRETARELSQLYTDWSNQERRAQLPPLKLIRGPAIAATTHGKKFSSRGGGRPERDFRRMPFMWTQSCHFPGSSVNQDLGAISQSTVAVHVAGFRKRITERQGHNHNQGAGPGKPCSSVHGPAEWDWLQGLEKLAVSWEAAGRELALVPTPGVHTAFSGKGSANSHGSSKPLA